MLTYIAGISACGKGKQLRELLDGKRVRCLITHKGTITLGGVIVGQSAKLNAMYNQ